MKGKADCEKLLDELIPFAEKMLREYGEFLPFGGYMLPEGAIVHAGAQSGEEHPPSQDLIDILRGAYQKKASRREVRATALVYDVRVKPPGGDQVQDAILVELDHETHYSIRVVFPYRLLNGAISRGETFAMKGTDAVFGGGR